MIGSNEAHIAATSQLAEGFLALTTAAAFDPGPEREPWEQAGRRVLDLVEDPEGTVVFAGQVHGDAVPIVHDLAPGVHRIPECDGLVTADPRTYLIIKTADCLPLVLVDPVARIAGCCHAGWRGTLLGIAQRTLHQMNTLGAEPHRVRAWIGPCISKKNYEVSHDLVAEFQNKWGHLGPFVEGRFLDLPELNSKQLQASGLPAKSIARSGQCTYEHKDLFHSHRRQGKLRGQLFTICGFR